MGKEQNKKAERYIFFDTLRRSLPLLLSQDIHNFILFCNINTTTTKSRNKRICVCDCRHRHPVILSSRWHLYSGIYIPDKYIGRGIVLQKKL